MTTRHEPYKGDAWFICCHKEPTVTDNRTWTEEEYEAAGLKSIHLRLPEDVHQSLAWLAMSLAEGRAAIVSRLVQSEVDKVRSGR